MALPNVAVPTAMDSLSQALRTNIIPNQEYLLQGSIIDSAVEHLLHRLKGLCDNVDTGPEQFHDHEICLSLRAPNQTVCISLFARIHYVPTYLKITFYFIESSVVTRSQSTRRRRTVPIAIRWPIGIGRSNTSDHRSFEFGYCLHRIDCRISHRNGMPHRFRVCESWLYVSQRTHENYRLENIQSERNAIETGRHIQRANIAELFGRIVCVGNNWTRCNWRRYASVCRTIEAIGTVGENRFQTIGKSTIRIQCYINLHFDHILI